MGREPLIGIVRRHQEEQAVEYVLVGRSNGRRQVRWGTALLLSCALGSFCAMIAAGAYFALSGTWSAPAAIVGFFGPFLAVGVGIQSAFQLPVDQLKPLDGPAT